MPPPHTANSANEAGVANPANEAGVANSANEAGVANEYATTTSKQELPIPPTKPPPHTAKDVKQWQETWYEADGLKAAMSTGDTLLVDGIWLKEQAVAGNVLPPRQGLPDAAASDLTVVTKKLWDDLKEPYKCSRDHAIITAISYCWANRNHPDEHGEQLQRLRRPLELMVPSWCVVAFFLDWCSL